MPPDWQSEPRRARRISVELRSANVVKRASSLVHRDRQEKRALDVERLDLVPDARFEHNHAAALQIHLALGQMHAHVALCGLDAHPANGVMLAQPSTRLERSERHTKGG